MNWAALIWFVLMLFFLMMESSTVAVIALWFAAGSLVAMIASLVGAQLWLQVVLFFAVSVVLLAALRPLTKKLFTPKLVKTNVDAVIGTVGVVTTRVDNIAATGQVKLGAMEWSARSVSGQTIEKGTQVKVDRIEGVKAFVSPISDAK